VSIRVFVDSVYWIALANPADPWRREALAAAPDAGTALVTTEAVLFEVANALCRRDLRRLAVAMTDAILDDEHVTVVRPTPSLFTASWTLYRDRPDKDWSLTDCASFIVMKERRITDALTTDVHFAQAGFKVLLGRR
jgi:predicted nucleic acid-binding protein